MAASCVVLALWPCVATGPAAGLVLDDSSACAGGSDCLFLLQEAARVQETARRQEAMPGKMRAAVATGNGGSCLDFTDKYCDRHFERIHVEIVPRPALFVGQALINVQASSINPIDWKMLPMTHGLLGKDFAGEVVRTSLGCRFSAGDLVWGDWLPGGSFAECVAVDCNKMGIRPTGFSAAEAGALPHVALAGLQALMHAGAPWSQKPTVLVLGASGGTGHVGVQLAKALGAGRVLATNSLATDSMVRSLGADQTIDYHAHNWWEVAKNVDVVYDCVGEKDTAAHALQVLNTGGFLVTIGDGVVAHSGKAPSRPDVTLIFSALREVSTSRLDMLKQFVDRGELKVVIGDTFDLDSIPAAMLKFWEGHVHGKLSVVIGAK